MANPAWYPDLRSYTGGPQGDPATIDEVAAASGGPLVGNLANRAELGTPGAHAQFVLSGGNYFDLTGAEIELRNAGNNQMVAFRMDGYVYIGHEDDLEPRSTRILHGPYDWSSDHLTTMAIFAHTARIVCAGPDSRLVIVNRHTETAYAAEPGARCVMLVENDNSQSRIRMTVLGGPMVENVDRAVPANGNSANSKRTGTEIIVWRVTAAVPVRDLEWASGYCDWRPQTSGGRVWATPTRFVMRSLTSIKTLGFRDFSRVSPLVFGSAEVASEVKVGSLADSIWLHGLYGTGNNGNDCRVVWMNLDGPRLTQNFAVFGQAKGVVVENHLSVDYSLIDERGSPIAGANVSLWSRDPEISALTNDAAANPPSVTWPTHNLRRHDSVSGADGKGSIGGATGAYSQAVCVEAFRRGTTQTGGNKDYSYGDVNWYGCAYGSYASLKYGVWKFGFQVLASQVFSAKLSGQEGAGKQTLGVLKLAAENRLTAADSASVPASPLTLDDVFDGAYKESLDNRHGLPLATTGSVLDFGSLNVNFHEFSGYAYSANLLTYNIPMSAAIRTGSKFTRIRTTGAVTNSTSHDLLVVVEDSAGTNAIVEIEGPEGSSVALYRRSTGSRFGGEFTPSAGSRSVAYNIPGGSLGEYVAVAARPGFAPVTQAVDTAGGGVFRITLGDLERQILPDGERMYVDGVDLSSRVSVLFDFSALTDPHARILIGDSLVRARDCYHRFSSAIAMGDGLRYLALGGDLVTVNVDPVNGDSLYLGESVRLRRAQAGDGNSGILAVAYHPAGQPVDDSQGDVQVVGGIVLDDFVRALLHDADLDSIEANTQSVATVLVDLRSRASELVTRSERVEGKVDATRDHARAANSQTQR